MISELLAILKEIWSYIWPFEIIMQWQRAGYYRNGKFVRVVGPGLKIKVPWFQNYEPVGMVPNPLVTGRMDITLEDGTLSFDATAQMVVLDPEKALNNIDDYHTSTVQILASVLSDKLAQVEREQLSPSRRGRLMSNLHRWVNAETSDFGVEIRNIRFNSFVLNIKTFRLLTGEGAGFSL